MEQGTSEEQAAAMAQGLRSLWAAGNHGPAGLKAALALIATMVLAQGLAQATTARLSFNVLTVSFPAADPDLTPAIGATENPVQVKVVVKGEQPSIMSQLTVQAAGDLQSGPDRIPVDRITWTAQGQGFVSGTLSSSQPQLVGQWTGKVDSTGQLRFWLQNSWSYAAGVYSQSLVYTLVAY